MKDKKGQKKKILIIEDEPAVYKALSDRLIKEGYETVIATDGAEGLQKAIKCKPDLILLDIILPVMDGMTMLKLLREQSFGKKIPVIILTNLSNGGMTAEALEQGAFHYLVKTDWKLGDVIKKVNDELTGK
ncbi:response regulator [Candidatus Uhrbacteria bacterium]|nr:response regulator [Candidatus Uhrbacteria bacterium]